MRSRSNSLSSKAPRSKSSRFIVLVALLVASAAASGVWSWTSRSVERSRATALGETRVAAESEPRPAADLTPNSAEPAAHEPAELAAWKHERKLGFSPPLPDTLAAVRGRVLDARTGAAMPGFTLTFLSRRPRTARAVTDAEGFFSTQVELATGVVAVVHVPDVEKPQLTARWSLDPGEFLLPPVAPGAPPFELTLRAKSPESVLEVEVVLPDGRPADGASVALTGGVRDARGRFEADVRTFEVADVRGRARFALFGADALQRSYRLEADRDGALVSELIEIEPPVALRPRQIDLAPGGFIRVRTTSDGRPVPGVSLWLSSNEGGRFVTGRQAESDARGDALFGGLRAGCWSVTALHPLTGRASTQPIDLARGAHADVDFGFSLIGLRLALSGVVLDESGDPLPAVQVRLRVTDEEPVQLETDDNGRFELWSRPASDVMVGVGTGFGDDRFDPESLTLPFGTTGFQVRRRARVESQTRTFVIVDAKTKARVPNSSIVLYHADANALEPAALRVAAPLGFAQSTFKCREGVRYSIEAPGYVRVDGSLAQLVKACGPNPAPLALELDAGFERSVEVRDRATKRAIEGANLEIQGRVLCTSSGEGKAHLSADAWPAAIQVRCAGYEPLAWDPLAAGWPGTTIWLEPKR